MERILSEQLVLLIGQALHFDRKFAVELPESLGCEGQEGHSEERALPLLRPAVLKGAEFASAGIGLHLLKQCDACTAGRKIAFDLSVPFCLVPLGEPDREHRLLIFGQRFDGLLYLGKVHTPMLPRLD